MAMCWNTHANEFLAPLDGNNYFVDLQPNLKQLPSTYSATVVIIARQCLFKRMTFFCSVFYYPLCKCNMIYFMCYL